MKLGWGDTDENGFKTENKGLNPDYWIWMDVSSSKGTSRVSIKILKCRTSLTVEVKFL